jgi:hypothetical protein
MRAVIADYRDSGEQEWENGTLDRFLDSLAAYANASVLDGGDQESPTWQLFAELVVAATGFE